MLILYDIPNWLLGFLVVTVCMVVSLGGHALVQRFWTHNKLADHERDLAMTVLGIAATVNSLLMAFSAVSVWDSFGSAEEAVGSEASTIGELARDLAIYGTPAADHARESLRSYTRSVVDHEWQTMRAGEESNVAWERFEETFRLVGMLEPDGPRRTALLPEILARVNELLKHRRERLYTSTAEVPGTLWSVVLIGTGVTMVLTFGLPNTRFNRAMIAVLALSFGLVFYFIVAMDRPFAGKESIDPGPFRGALSNMDRWDSGSGSGYGATR